MANRTDSNPTTPPVTFFSYFNDKPLAKDLAYIAACTAFGALAGAFIEIYVPLSKLTITLGACIGAIILVAAKRFHSHTSHVPVDVRQTYALIAHYNISEPKIVWTVEELETLINTESLLIYPNRDGGFRLEDEDECVVRYHVLREKYPLYIKSQHGFTLFSSSSKPDTISAARADSNTPICTKDNLLKAYTAAESVKIPSFEGIDTKEADKLTAICNRIKKYKWDEALGEMSVVTPKNTLLILDMIIGGIGEKIIQEKSLQYFKDQGVIRSWEQQGDNILIELP